MGNKVILQYAKFEMQGRRDSMEDAVATIERFNNKDSWAFFGVFDGHFGAGCSKWVARELPRILQEELKANPTEDVKKVMTRTCLKTDKLFLQYAKSQKSTMLDGSTGVWVFVKDGMIYCSNTGDSRAIMCKGGKLIALSEDQKPEQPAEKERIEKAGGVILMGRVQGKLAVARSFGDAEFKDLDKCEAKYITAEPVVKEVKFEEDVQFILIACDGLWDKISNEKAIDFVSRRLSSGVSIEQTVRDIVEFSYKEGSQDNITAILICLKNSDGTIRMPPMPADRPAEPAAAKATPPPASGGGPPKQSAQSQQPPSPRDADKDGAKTDKPREVGDAPPGGKKSGTKKRKPKPAGGDAAGGDATAGTKVDGDAAHKKHATEHAPAAKHDAKDDAKKDDSPKEESRKDDEKKKDDSKQEIKKEEPKKEEPKKEEPKKDAPKVEAKKDEPKKDAPKAETKKEEPKKEEAKKVEAKKEDGKKEEGKKDEGKKDDVVAKSDSKPSVTAKPADATASAKQDKPTKTEGTNGGGEPKKKNTDAETKPPASPKESK